MKLKELYEAEKKYEWRVSNNHDEPSAVLFTDYGKGRGFEYSAQFVHAREDGYEYYAQTVHYTGDRVEWGGEHTKQKRFSNRADVNTFLKKLQLPELTKAQFDELHPAGTIVACVKGSGGMSTDHYFVFGPSLVKFKADSKTEDEFMAKILSKFKDLTKNWTFGRKINSCLTSRPPVFLQNITPYI